MYRISITIIFVFFLGLATAFSQVHKEVIWKNINTAGNNNIQSFEGAFYDASKEMLPYLYMQTPNATKIKLSNIVYEAADITGISDAQKEFIVSETKIEENISTARQQNILEVHIPVYIKAGNNISRIISFDYEYVFGTTNYSPAVNFKKQATNSVLAEGEWYKMSVSKKGMHKITYQNLKDWGINVDNINPKQIAVFGNGGGALPEANNLPRYDDLQENAIEVIGEADGKFDNGDYILCYLQDANKWILNGGNFEQSIHPYSNEYFYFITIKNTNGLRINTLPIENAASTTAVTTFSDYAIHQLENYTTVSKELKSGRNFWGEEFDGKTEYTLPEFNFPNIDATANTNIKIAVMARNVGHSATFSYKLNGEVLGSTSIGASSEDYVSPFGNITNTNYNRTLASDKISINIAYNKVAFADKGFLDYVLINTRRRLIMSGNTLAFRDLKSVGNGAISQFTLSNAKDATVWNITNTTMPLKVNAQALADIFTFRANTSTLNEYVAFKGNDFPAPKIIGKVTNQNLHGIDYTNMIVVTAPEFMSVANEYAAYRTSKSNIKVTVVTPEMIYNEYSSGTPDATAIRDFVKHLYTKNGTDKTKAPEYLLLMGDGSHDNKNLLGKNQNKIPTYQSTNSIAPLASYVCDDFYGLLDNDEGSSINGGLDIAIGRMPVNTKEEAKSALDKIINYESPANFNAFKSKLLLIGDDKDNNTHIGNSDGSEMIYKAINSKNKIYDIDKVYVDAFPAVSAQGERRFPDVNKAIVRKVAEGTFATIYTGHGGEIGWGHERFLTIADINKFSNKNALSFFVTATCSFARWDEPEGTSAGELVYLNTNGGSIAMATTTRIVFVSNNTELLTNFNANFMDIKTKNYKTFGQLFSATKNSAGLRGQENFSLLGDPATLLSIPEFNIKIKSINGTDLNAFRDTIKALSKVNMVGEVVDNNGIPLTSFNGTVSVTFYDKEATLSTLGQDASSPKMNYQLYKNIIYKGQATVTAGIFTINFIVPKDINYNVGKGKISLYAKNGKTDAAGFNDTLKIGSISNEVITDKEGPRITLFMNNEQFVKGGLVNENPIIIGKLSDVSGINTVGNGIGHNIIATVTNQNTKQEIDLNQYYQAKENSYTDGEVKYNLTELPEGKYTLRLKAWDVVNNSNAEETEFIVAKNEQLTINRVYNYPNPFTTNTQFMFEHNKPTDQLKVLLQVYSVSGKLVKTINRNLNGQASGRESLSWDGKDDYGDKIGRGVYIYKLQVKGSDGTRAEKIEKLAIIN